MIDKKAGEKPISFELSIGRRLQTYSLNLLMTKNVLEFRRKFSHKSSFFFLKMSKDKVVVRSQPSSFPLDHYRYYAFYLIIF